MSSLVYRPDIDGLRAVAVLSVILFHAGVPFMGGGFVGVDVFFVISGFLITSLILKDLESESFTFARFWERRARRILPALCVMVFACLAAGWVLFLPGDFEALGKQVAAHLLERAGRGHYRFHGLVRTYATERLGVDEPVSRSRRALERLASHSNLWLAS